MTRRLPHRTRRGKIAQNIVNNTPAGDWRLASSKEKTRLGIASKEPFYVRKNVQVRKGSVFLSRDEFTKKSTGLTRRKLAEARAAEGGATHPRHGYKRPLSAKMRELLNKRRRLALVRKARAAYERRGSALAAFVADWRATPTTPTSGRLAGRPKAPWPRFNEQLNDAIGPDTAEPIASRELGAKDTRIPDGNWHTMIDILKMREGEDSPIVKLLRSSGRFVEGGVWVVDQGA